HKERAHKPGGERLPEHTRVSLGRRDRGGEWLEGRLRRAVAIGVGALARGSARRFAGRPTLYDAMLGTACGPARQGESRGLEVFIGQAVSAFVRHEVVLNVPKRNSAVRPKLLGS